MVFRWILEPSFSFRKILRRISHWDFRISKRVSKVSKCDIDFVSGQKKDSVNLNGIRAAIGNLKNWHFVLIYNFNCVITIIPVPISRERIIQIFGYQNSVKVGSKKILHRYIKAIIFNIWNNWRFKRCLKRPHVKWKCCKRTIGQKCRIISSWVSSNLKGNYGTICRKFRRLPFAQNSQGFQSHIGFNRWQDISGGRFGIIFGLLKLPPKYNHTEEGNRKKNKSPIPRLRIGYAMNPII